MNKKVLTFLIYWSAVMWAIDLSIVLVARAVSPPTSLMASTDSATVSSGQIKLAWNASTNMVGVSYQVYRNDILIATTLATSYTDIATNANQEFRYTVVAVDTNGVAISPLACISAWSIPPIVITLNAPSNLVITSVSSNSVTLVWEDNSDNEAGFQIERASSTNGWSIIGQAPLNATTYTDTTVLPHVSYDYRVEAFK
jgi:hypothetical protein